VIDRSEIQSLVLRPSAAARMHIDFYRFGERGGLEYFLRRARSLVTYSDAPTSGASVINLGLTAEGIRLLGAGERSQAALPPAFMGGMRSAAERLGDRGASAPSTWEPPFQTGGPAVHAVVITLLPEPTTTPSPQQAVFEEAFTEQRVGQWTGESRGGLEPFGFRDNITDPVIEGSGRSVTPGNGVWDEDAHRWRAVRAGEAVLGRVDESGGIAGHPDAAQIERDGSYLVIRKLAQDKQAFDDACADIAAQSARNVPGRPPVAKLSAEDVAAQLVGRHRDGRALGQPVGEEPRNGFRYRDGGKTGKATPLSSHIRRSNPRDDIESAKKMMPRHLIFRRGMPYGRPEGDEGLLFLAVCSSISRQFEFVQGQWLQDGNRFGLGQEPDGLTGLRYPSTAGHPTDAVSVARADGSRLNCRPISTFVTTKGGEYVLLPSRSALELMAPGDVEPDGEAVGQTNGGAYA